MGLYLGPHHIEISPYNPAKHLWIVDADNHFVSEVTRDGKQRILTLGTPAVPGDDDTHFRRPTFMAFMDAASLGPSKIPLPSTH